MWCKGERWGVVRRAVTVWMSAVSECPFRERTTVVSCVWLDPSLRFATDSAECPACLRSHTEVAQLTKVLLKVSLF